MHEVEHTVGEADLEAELLPRRDLLDGSPLTVTSCDGSNLFLKAGAHRISVVGTVEFRVRSLVLTPRDLPLPGPHRSVTVRSWGNQHRTVTVAAGDAALLSLPEAAGAGWHATLGGHALAPMMVDGWAQGWVVPAGAGGLVHLDFAPDGPYRLSLLIGLLAVLLLVALAVRAVRDPQHDALVVPNAVDPRLPTAVLVVAGALVVGGWAGLIGAAASVIAVRFGKRGCAAVAVWVLPLVDVLLIERDKATTVFSAQAGATSQWLCLLAVGALAGLLTAASGSSQASDPDEAAEAPGSVSRGSGSSGS